jgi:NAD(P)-dependent dehydrogenase (short-subunit alcohol dehydrogenase family)
MAFTVQADSFRFKPELRSGVAGKRVLITGAGKDRGLGQAFALAAGLNGAAKVGVHFHSSYVDAFDLVAELRKEGVDAFPVHADVTNLGDLWAMRSYVIEQMGGSPPNLLICNSDSFSGEAGNRQARERVGNGREQRRGFGAHARRAGDREGAGDFHPV